MLHTPTLISELAAKCAEDEIQRQQSIVAEATANHNQFARLLNEVVEDFMWTGIGRPPKEVWYWCGYREQGRWDWSAYINRLAKELKRPYVFAPRHALAFTIEKKAYTRPLYAHLLLIATEKVRNDWKSIQGKDVFYEQSGSRITFHFQNNVGLTLHTDWFERCKTDPEFRTALRLGTNPRE